MNSEVRTYRCPGETYDIDSAVHLGRLATFYPSCRQCPHREDTTPLPRRTVRRLAASHARTNVGATLTDEGVVGVYRNQLTPALARDYAAALGIYLRETTNVDSPAVAVAGDGRPLSPEFVAAACDGVRWAGCRAIDFGAATAGCLMHGLSAMMDPCGGLLVGNPTSDPQIVGLKFWGPQARPLSLGHGLERLHELVTSRLDRPTRTYGGLDRVNVDDAHLGTLRDDFHALRPLRFVLDTGCLPLRRYLRLLTSAVACEVIEASEPIRRHVDRSVDFSPHSTASGRKGKPLSPPPALPRRSADARIKSLGQQVCDRSAHFGLWIDGDGEVCRAVDERGQALPGDGLLQVLARHVCASQAGATVVVENTTSPRVLSALKAAGVCVDSTGSKRAEMDTAVRESGSLLGGGPSGRVVHHLGAPPALPCADALRTLALLLAALSTSDSPLSEVAALR